MKRPPADQKLKERYRQHQEIIREDARRKHRLGAHRRKTEPPENALLAKRDQLHAESPETSHHGRTQDGSEDVTDPLRGSSAYKEHRAQQKQKRHHQAE